MTEYISSLRKLIGHAKGFVETGHDEYLVHMKKHL